MPFYGIYLLAVFSKAQALDQMNQPALMLFLLPMESWLLKFGDDLLGLHQFFLEAEAGLEQTICHLEVHQIVFVGVLILKLLEVDDV